MFFEPLDTTKLDPGVRRLVTELREAGFDTQASGDGATHAHACDQPNPYVYILVEDAADLLLDCHALKDWCTANGITVQTFDEAGSLPAIDGSYNPADNLAVIALWNVTDAMLPAVGEA